MRKMFTRLFSLALFLCMTGFLTDISAQTASTFTKDDVVLQTAIANICDSTYVKYKIGVNSATSTAYIRTGSNSLFTEVTENPYGIAESIPFEVFVMTGTASSDTFSFENEIVAPVVIDSVVAVDPICYGDKGVVNVYASGGVASEYVASTSVNAYYFVPEYDWAGPSASAYESSNYKITSTSLQNADTVKYYVAVLDGNSCTDLDTISSWDSVIVASPTPIAVDTVYAGSIECIGDTDTVTVVVSGGDSDEYYVTIKDLAGTEFGTKKTENDTAYFELVAGTYLAYAADEPGYAAGCEGVESKDTAFLKEPSEITCTGIGLSDATCADSATGVIGLADFVGVDTTGGASAAYSSLCFTVIGPDTAIYNYNTHGISAATDTVKFENLIAGSYQVWIKASLTACDSFPFSGNSQNYIEVKEPEAITFDVSYSRESCGADDIKISVTNAAGGSGNYLYACEDTAGGFSASLSSIAEWSITCPDSAVFAITVKDQDNGCIISDTLVVLGIGSVEILSLDSISPTCPGNNDGEIVVTASGGSGVYEYSTDSLNWYDNNILVNYAGKYKVYVKDKVCSDLIAVDSTTIIALRPDSIEITYRDTFIDCHGGLGAIGLDTTSWADQTGSDNRKITYYAVENESDVFNAASMVQKTEDDTIRDLNSGKTYYIWAEDNYGCQSANYVSATVIAAGELEFEAYITDSSAACYGSTDAVITLKKVAGIPSKYARANTIAAAWALADGAFSTWPVGADTVNLQVGKGTYYVVVTDSCDNKIVDSTAFVIGGLDKVVIDDEATSITDNKCFEAEDGVIVMNAATGGHENFTYTLQRYVDGAWSNYLPYVDTALTTFTSLPSDTFKVIVNDYEDAAFSVAGCAGDETDSLLIVDGPEVPVSATFSSSDITCYNAGDGMINIKATGNTDSVYYYTIEGGTIQSKKYQFKDNNGNKTDSVSITIPQQGDYTVTVTDEYGCGEIDTTITINEPEEISITLNAVRMDSASECEIRRMGYIAATFSGGGLATSDSFNVVIEGINAGVTVYNDTLNIEAGSNYVWDTLPAASYTIYAFDTVESNCFVTVDTTIDELETLYFADSYPSTDTVCFGDLGSISVKGVGGVPPYSFVLQDTVGGGTHVGSIWSVAADSVAVFTDLEPGTYVVGITDSNPYGFPCSPKPSQNITINEYDSIAVSAEWVADITCTNEYGEFTVNATGAHNAFKYYATVDTLTGVTQLDDPDVNDPAWQTDTLFKVTEPGLYVVWAMDTITGCMVGGEAYYDGSAAIDWRVTVNDLHYTFDINPDYTDSVVCNESTDGYIKLPSDSVTIYDGTIVVTSEDYIYKISKLDTAANTSEVIKDSISSTTDSIGGLDGGIYEIEVTTVNTLCSGTDTISIYCPEPLSVELVKADGDFNCPGGLSGTLEAYAEGGCGIYQYQLWKDGEQYSPSPAAAVQYSSSNKFFDIEVGHFYQVIVKDTNNCASDISDTIFIESVDETEYTVEDITCDPSSTKGSARVTVLNPDPTRGYYVVYSQYEPDYGYHTDTTEVFNESIDILDTFIFDDDDNNKDAHYEFVVKDTMCTSYESGKDTITFNRADVNALAFTVTEGSMDSCGTSVVIDITNGVAPYNVLIDGEIVDTAITATSGTYSVTGGIHTFEVEDSRSCPPSPIVDTFAYPQDDDVQLYAVVGEAVNYVDTVAGISDVLYAGDDTTYTYGDATCLRQVNVSVDTAVAPVVDTMSPVDTIENTTVANFVITFEEDVTFNDTVAGKLYVKPVDENDAGGMEIEITADMVSGNTITVPGTEELDKYTTYAVTVDPEVVVGKGLAWDGVVNNWTFTTSDFATENNDLDGETIEFKVYPNPFDSYIQITNYDQIDRVIVTNIAGQRVIDVKYPDSEISTSNLSSGVYVVTMIVDGKIVKSERIVKK